MCKFFFKIKIKIYNKKDLDLQFVLNIKFKFEKIIIIRFFKYKFAKKVKNQQNIKFFYSVSFYKQFYNNYF